MASIVPLSYIKKNSFIKNLVFLGTSAKNPYGSKAEAVPTFWETGNLTQKYDIIEKKGVNT